MKKNKTIKQVINELQRSGHDVRYRKRTDGGYLITSINGEKFTGAKGNAKARTLTGTELSKKRSKQLKSITPLDKELNRVLKETQKIWKENKTPKDGRITRKRVNQKIAIEGKREAIKALKEAQKYAQGIANSENVEWLIERLEMANKKGKLDEIIEWIKNHKDTFKEDWIDEVNQIMYKVDQGRTAIEAAIPMLKRIINFK